MTVYKIQPTIPHEDNHVYFGSTMKHIDERYKEHKKVYSDWLMGKNDNYCNSVEVFKKYGFENCEAIILEDNLPVDKLKDVEDSYIMKYPCMNKQLNPLMKGYEEKLNVVYKEVTSLKKTKQNEKYKSNEELRERIKKQTKERLSNPVMNTSKDCPCGGRYSIRNATAHFKSDRHQRYILFKETVKTAI
jgi:hypothetical protein